MSNKKDFLDQSIIDQILSQLSYLESMSGSYNEVTQEDGDPEVLCEIALFMLLPDGHELTERLLPESDSDYIFGDTDDRRIEVVRAAALLIAALRKIPA